MKLGIILFLALLLTGCAAQSESTLPPETEAAAEVTPMTIPATLPPQPSGETLPAAVPPPESDAAFVRVADFLPEAVQELRYATENNFTGQVIYDFQQTWLRWGTVKKLMAVSADLKELGLGLKIWDGFRPVSAQYALWEVCPDPTYVANPNVGHSSHSRGNTVDVTLVDADGGELEMPTDFDDFSALADRDYADCTAAAADNARILELLMEKHGFKGYFGEWWHFSDTVSYPVEEHFSPEP